MLSFFSIARVYTISPLYYTIYNATGCSSSSRRSTMKHPRARTEYQDRHEAISATTPSQTHTYASSCGVYETRRGLYALCLFLICLRAAQLSLRNAISTRLVVPRGALLRRFEVKLAARAAAAATSLCSDSRDEKESKKKKKSSAAILLTYRPPTFFEPRDTLLCRRCCCCCRFIASLLSQLTYIYIYVYT